MDAKALSHADYLDILFDNRNKQYGSYELRRNYDKRAKTSLLTMLVVCAAVSAYAFINSSKPDIAITEPNVVPTKMTEIIYDKKPLEIEKPKPIAPPAVKPTVANTVPKVVQDKGVIAPPPTKEDLAHAESGIITTTGTPGGDVVVSKPTEGIGVIGGHAELPSKPIGYTEEMPQFMGDINVYLSKNLQYPAVARHGNVEGKLAIRFVVNEDGSVSDAEVVRGIGGGCDEEALRVIMNMPKWKPGKHNGKAVKVYYTLPIKFILE